MIKRTHYIDQGTQIEPKFSGDNTVDFPSSFNSDGTGLDSTGKTLMAHYQAPKTGINLTFGSSGTIYTAPADGYFSVYYHVDTEDQKYVSLTNTSRSGCDAMASSLRNSNFWIRTMVPARKGDMIRLDYNIVWERDRAITFVYLNKR